VRPVALVFSRDHGVDQEHVIRAFPYIALLGCPWHYFILSIITGS
jgi:hypothetical protein